jgi:hypothetical protein
MLPLLSAVREESGTVAIVASLEQMLQKYEPFMGVTIDEEGYYRLYTPTRRPFIAVAIQKNTLVSILCQFSIISLLSGN